MSRIILQSRVHLFPSSSQLGLSGWLPFWATVDLRSLTFSHVAFPASSGPWAFLSTGSWRSLLRFDSVISLVLDNCFPQILGKEASKLFSPSFHTRRKCSRFASEIKMTWWHLAQLPSGCWFPLPFPGHHLRWKTAAWQGAGCLTSVWSLTLRGTKYHADGGFPGLLESLQNL